MKKILVTGGAGFIGSHTVDLLLSRGYSVVVLDNFSTGKGENLPNGVDVFHVDICDFDGLRNAFEGVRPDAVIHLAAQASVERSMRKPSFDADVNIVGSINVLECCRKMGAKRVVYASSAAVYGQPQSLPMREDHPISPISFYGASKHTIEHYLEVYLANYGVDYVVLRYANVYGPRQDARGEAGVVAIFVDRLLRGLPPIIFGDGEQTRDFIYVGDVAEANVIALESERSGFAVNISFNASTSVNDIANSLLGMTGSILKPIHGNPRKGDVRHSRLDNSRARDLLGWSPKTPLERGLRDTVEYFKGRSLT
ncbi:MAG: SDR family oxidoreductase [bacterium]